MKRRKVYIAGPMSGLPGLNFVAFHTAADGLREAGFEVINPAEINADSTKPWHECMKADIRELVLCDGVALLPGWENSRGARIEKQLADDLGIEAWPLAMLLG